MRKLKGQLLPEEFQVIAGSHLIRACPLPGQPDETAWPIVTSQVEWWGTGNLDVEISAGQKHSVWFTALLKR
jgi:hypothetical protein